MKKARLPNRKGRIPIPVAHALNWAHRFCERTNEKTPHRRALAGVFWQNVGGVHTVWATDTYRLWMARREHPQRADDGQGPYAFPRSNTIWWLPRTAVNAVAAHQPHLQVRPRHRVRHALDLHHHGHELQLDLMPLGLGELEQRHGQPRIHAHPRQAVILMEGPPCPARRARIAVFVAVMEGPLAVFVAVMEGPVAHVTRSLGEG